MYISNIQPRGAFDLTVTIVHILYINLVCRNDAIIMQYIIYSTLERPDIQNIGPVVGVQGCDIALGLYHILEHPQQVLYFVYKTY